MLPTAVKRVQFYSRNSHEKYVYWLIDSVDIPYNEELFKTNSRNVVDSMVLRMINEGKTITEETVFEPIAREIEDTPVEIIIEKIEEEEPSWVEAARGAISEVVEDVVEEIQEKVEEVVEVVENVIEDAVGITFDKPVENVEENLEMMIVPESDNPFGGEIDYNSYTVRELQKECKARGITIRGTKSEVVLRLRHDDAGIVEQPTQGVTEAHSQESANVTPDAPSQEAATEEVTTDDDSGQTELTSEEE
ncbi:SAP domain-containing protein [bacterium]|nr:SAP domain-containing protein [bacterium]